MGTFNLGAAITSPPSDERLERVCCSTPKFSDARPPLELLPEFGIPPGEGGDEGGPTAETARAACAFCLIFADGFREEAFCGLGKLGMLNASSAGAADLFDGLLARFNGVKGVSVVPACEGAFTPPDTE